MKRVYIEAALIGVGIGLTALALQQLLGGGHWLAQIAGFLVGGGLLCALQYGVVRFRSGGNKKRS